MKSLQTTCLLISLISFGCSNSPTDVTSETAEPAPTENTQQPREQPANLDGTYSVDGGQTNLTIEQLGGTAYAVTLSDGRTVSCTLDQGVLTGTVEGENVTVAVEGASATLVAFGNSAEFGKITNDVRSIPVAEPIASSPPSVVQDDPMPEPVVAQFPADEDEGGKETSEEDATPELVNLEELNTSGNDWYPWVTPDGLMIFWEAPNPEKEGNWLWSATRKDADSPFEKVQIISQGHHVTTSPDGLEVITTGPRPGGQKGSCLYVGTRTAADKPVQKLTPIRELLTEINPKGPALSDDGLTLYFVRTMLNGKGIEIAQATRPTRSGRWSKASPVPVSQRRPGEKGNYTWPFLGSKGLSMLTAIEPATVAGGPTNFVEWQRGSTSKAFSSPTKLELEVDGVFGRSPRYIEATDELFFCKPSDDGGWDLWVVKNFEGKEK